MMNSKTMRKIKFQASFHLKGRIGWKIDNFLGEITKLINLHGYSTGDFSHTVFDPYEKNIEGYLEVDEKIVIKLIEYGNFQISNTQFKKMEKPHCFVRFRAKLDLQTVDDEEVEKIATDQTNRMTHEELLDYVTEDKIMWMNERSGSWMKNRLEYWEEVKYEINRRMNDE